VRKMEHPPFSCATSLSKPVDSPPIITTTGSMKSTSLKGKARFDTRVERRESSPETSSCSHRARSISSRQVQRLSSSSAWCPNEAHGQPSWSRACRRIEMRTILAIGFSHKAPMATAAGFRALFSTQQREFSIVLVETITLGRRTNHTTTE